MINTIAQKTEQSFSHIPVMLKEVISHINPVDGGYYLDCTFGAGGYSKAIIQHANCHIVGVDQDPTVIKFVEAMQQHSNTRDRFQFVNDNFGNISKYNFRDKFNGIVLDLGVSSMQIDNAKRGFSFQKDGPLDMRMGNHGISAKEFIASAAEQDIADVIYKYSGEHKSRAIAKAIVNVRNTDEIDTTFKLADIIRSVTGVRGKSKIDPATKAFQAIRIFINKELESLETFLGTIKELLKPNGVVVVVSFHSLEDAIVKNFFKDHSPKKIARSKYAKHIDSPSANEWLEVITKRPVIATDEEIGNNVRARSAKLRAARMIAGGVL